MLWAPYFAYICSYILLNPVMYKVLIIISLFISISLQSDAQVFPKEGATLNYRIIGFSLPVVNKTGKYKIEIAYGNYDEMGSFNKNIIQNIYSENNKIIIEVPAFGAQYTWQAVYIPLPGDSQKTKSPLYHFSTGTIPVVDTTINRLRITTPAKQYKDAFVFIDALGVLYDMNGRPVWYLPKTGNTGFAPGAIRDLKLSPMGTITFFNDYSIYEISYNGNILWKGPDNTDKNKKYGQGNYHHEFTRLNNGHYMVLGHENLLCKLPSANDSSYRVITDNKIKKDSTTTYAEIPFGTLIEYDEKGNEVWIWKTFKYFISSGLNFKFKSNELPDLHDNAFFFDEQNKNIYISFKNTNSVIKVKYPEGDILNVYDGTHSSGMIAGKNVLFGNQHAVKRSQNGYLYLYDNSNDTGALSSKIVIMQPSSSGNDSLSLVWEYKCLIDDKDGYSPSKPGAVGGNVIELPDHSIFAAMGKEYSKVFIVNLNKEIIWSAIAETRDKTDKKWHMYPGGYRASIIIDPKDLEKLIWNSEKTVSNPL